MDEITYFVLLESYEIEHMYKVSKFFSRNKLYIIKFIEKNLSDPDSEPVAMYYTNGVRHYMIKDDTYVEYDISADYVRSVVRIHGQLDDKLNNILSEYKNQTVAPRPDWGHGFVRAVTLVSDRFT